MFMCVFVCAHYCGFYLVFYANDISRHACMCPCAHGRFVHSFATRFAIRFSLTPILGVTDVVLGVSLTYTVCS